MKAKYELKPCPVCGSKDVELCERDNYLWVYSIYGVFCWDCNEYWGRFNTKRKAVEAWNRIARDD